MTFNPKEHLSNLKNKDYLEVKWRLVWFRDSHPHGTIKTELLRLDLDKNMAVFKATIDDGEGGIGEGHGSETAKDFNDFIEKAETKAIGRALAALGFGTQFAPELEEGERIVDSPVQSAHKQPRPAQQPTKPATTQPSTKPPSINETQNPEPNKKNPAQFTKVEDYPAISDLKREATKHKISWNALLKRVGCEGMADDAITPRKAGEISAIIEAYKVKNGGDLPKAS